MNAIETIQYQAEHNMYSDNQYMNNIEPSECSGQNECFEQNKYVKVNTVISPSKRREELYEIGQNAAICIFGEQVIKELNIDVIFEIYSEIGKIMQYEEKSRAIYDEYDMITCDNEYIRNFFCDLVNNNINQTNENNDDNEEELSYYEKYNDY